MIEHDGYYYFLRPITGVYGKVRWSVVKRPVQPINPSRVQIVRKSTTLGDLENEQDEVLATGLTTEEADNYLKLLR